jgi:nicotinamidase-related amidase
MDLNRIEINKTGLLFFDVLNGYYHLASPAAKERKKPMIDNAVLLMKAARKALMPIFFAMGSHREDEGTTVLINTDTNIPLKPWPDGIVTMVKPNTVEGKSSAEVIPELEPGPNDYYLPKHRWSAFFQTYLDLALRARKIDTVIVSGGSTDVGVASTVFAGKDMDYNFIVVRDACATNHDQRAHDVLMDLIFPRMSRVRTTAEVVRIIEEAG